MANFNCEERQASSEKKNEKKNDLLQINGCGKFIDRVHALVFLWIEFNFSNKATEPVNLSPKTICALITHSLCFTRLSVMPRPKTALAFIYIMQAILYLFYYQRWHCNQSESWWFMVITGHWFSLLAGLVDGATTHLGSRLDGGGSAAEETSG